MSREKINHSPSRGARAGSIICALGMMLCLFLTGMLLLGTQLATSAPLHARASLTEERLDQQMSRIQKEIQDIAGEYGFRAEPILALLNREEVEHLDREVIAWWTGALTTGQVGEAPSFDLEGAEQALRGQEEFLATLDPMLVSSQVNTILGRIQESVRASGFFFRELLFQAGLRKAGERFNLPMILSLLRKAPWVLGLLALLLAGCIALIHSRSIRYAWREIGTGLSACGLMGLCVLLSARLLNLREMIGEASESLVAQYDHLAGIVCREVICGAAVLMLLGGILMTLSRKK